MKCPACRRLLEQRPDQCPRCGMELTRIHELNAWHERLHQAGCRCLRQRAFRDALKCYAGALAIRKTTPTEQGLFTALVCVGRYEEALRFYLRQQPQKEQT